jgi:hypoxanthine phosphoribosyltransferase
MREAGMELAPDLERVLIPPEAIARRVEELASEIESDYTGEGELLFVGVLKGAFIFLADLTRRVRLPHTVDFMAISSYGKASVSSGAVRILMDLREPVVNKHVILVEDIVDSGRTLAYLQETFTGRRPASLRTCVLVRKERENADVGIDYLGFTIPDVWVVGYGLDLAERFRTLPYIAEVKRSLYQK